MNPDTLISPIDLRDFLHVHGWTLRPEGLADRLYVLQNPRFPRRQLVFPMDTTVLDYAAAVDRVIEKLSEMINERPRTVRSRIQTVRDDTLRFRIDAPQNGDHSLPLGFAALLVTGAQQLLKAAACTVLRPRLHHPRLALTEALQLIEKADSVKLNRAALFSRSRVRFMRWTCRERCLLMKVACRLSGKLPSP